MTRHTAARIVIVALVPVLVATVLALFADLAWFLELFAHFRVQYLAAQAVAILLLAGLGRWRWMLVVAATALPNLWFVAPYLPGLVRPAPAMTANPAAVPGGESISLVALNLHYTNTRYATVREYLRGRSADLLVLSELTPAWTQALEGLGGTYPHKFLQPSADAWGLGIYSRFPIEQAARLDLVKGASAQVRVRLATPAGPVELYGVHLASPTRSGRAALRNRQLESLGDHLHRADPAIPRIVTGDFNLTPYSPYFGRLLEAAGLRDAGRLQGLRWTWPILGPLLGPTMAPALGLPLSIPIDHVLVNAGVLPGRVAAGPDVGSDHRPIEVRVTVVR